MASSREFATYVTDCLSPFGAVSTRAMFGGFSVSLRGITFGLILKDTLYLKTDAQTRAGYEKEGLPPFAYLKQGKLTPTSYFQAPDSLDDWESLGPWVRAAYDVAIRAKSAKPSRAKKRAPSKK